MTSAAYFKTLNSLNYNVEDLMKCSHVQDLEKDEDDPLDLPKSIDEEEIEELFCGCNST